MRSTSRARDLLRETLLSSARLTSGPGDGPDAEVVRGAHHDPGDVCGRDLSRMVRDHLEGVLACAPCRTAVR